MFLIQIQRNFRKLTKPIYWLVSNIILIGCFLYLLIFGTIFYLLGGTGSPLGAVRSEETRVKIAPPPPVGSRVWGGAPPAHTGKTHTPESKAQMSDSQQLVSESS